MKKGFVITETLVIALFTAILGAYVQKEHDVTHYIYNSDKNQTTVFWVSVEGNNG